MLQQLQSDTRIGKDKVLSAAALIRGSFVMLVLSGIVGAFIAQIVLGNGGLQFGVGLFVGYAAYIAYLLMRMKPPRVIGVMAVLTNRRLLLLGSKKVGVAAEWQLNQLEAIDVLRKGNLLVMGKIMIRPKDGDDLLFYLSNRKMGHHLVDTFNQTHKG